MKKLLSVLALLAMLSTSAFAQAAQTTENPATVQPADGAVMEFETMTVDYGTIAQGSEPFRLFKFTNTGNAPLVIKNAKGSCGCTVPTYPKEPILPGETGEIKVRYDTNRVGPFTKRVTLTTNSVEETVVLTIKGLVEKKAEEPAGVPSNDNGLFNGGN